MGSPPHSANNGTAPSWKYKKIQNPRINLLREDAFVHVLLGPGVQREESRFIHFPHFDERRDLVLRGVRAAGDELLQPILAPVLGRHAISLQEHGSVGVLL